MRPAHIIVLVAAATTLAGEAGLWLVYGPLYPAECALVVLAVAAVAWAIAGAWRDAGLSLGLAVRRVVRAMGGVL
jgi:hypothetical protein